VRALASKPVAARTHARSQHAEIVAVPSRSGCRPATLQA
jgi:hypothetical protein